MRWNASNTVPWKRLIREWVVIGVVVAAVSLLVTENRDASSYVTIALGGVIYVGFGAVLAKFGYQRKTLRQLRTEAAAQPARVVGRSSTAAAARPKPAPTSRTGGTPSSKRRR